MRYFNLKTLTMIAAFSLIALFATSEIVSAQVTYRDYKEMQKQQKRLEKSRRKYERQQQRTYNQQWRVYNNGGYYYTDDRGAQMLRQAVNYGYQQGYRAGQYDARRGNSFGYNSQNMYRTGTYGWSYVDQNQYRYYFQQGFQRGYQDGYYRTNRYGSNGGNILGSILNTILNISRNN
jgi:flagellar biosynthesis/type III secretory pathway protein FliH